MQKKVKPTKNYKHKEHEGKQMSKRKKQIKLSKYEVKNMTYWEED